MNAPLPDPIAAFFEASNGAVPFDPDRCFAVDAVVQDENRTHRGHAAIAAWLREAQRTTAFTAEPLEVVPRDAGMTIRARVAGNFPGSPVELDHVFRLADDRITNLEIG
ncbi:nuclear transport factor 2 family protein [Alienimonas sp. DA493]|uniref:nuclear transport factor 2 family protein n=1 Tax=Alienimonas sp. DA493 TaxID=3373605 RepID=UPI00375514DE